MKMKKTLFRFIILAAELLLGSCGGKVSPPPPLEVYDEEAFSGTGVDIPFEVYGNVRYVKVKVNGVEMEMIFDTGASGVSLSLTEAIFLAKQGKLTKDDFLGSTNIQTANGEVSEGMVVNLKEVELAEGLVATDVTAIIVGNLDTPLLLGNSALKDIGSFEIDDEAKVIRFNK